MEVIHSCLCCLRCPPDKDLTSPYTEIYSDMLKECFNIQMVLDGWESCGICSTCTDRLRDASHFKQQVQRCQEELRAREQANGRVKDESSVKLELATDETELLDELLGPEAAAGDGASDDEESVLLASPVCGSAESSVLLRARQQLAAACAVRLERLRELLYSCDECGKEFRIKSVLRKHIQRSHNVKDLLNSSHGSLYKSPKCHTLMLRTIECADNISFKSNLKRLQRMHTGEKLLLCDCCDYKCSKKSTLRIHQRIHTGEKPFKCGYCDYECSVKSSIHRHQRLHTGEKPFKCGYCDYKTGDKSHLITHQRIHTGEKPFECGYCDYKTGDKSHLKTHQRIHTGEKPFECGYCDYKSSKKSNLITHKRIHTGEKPFKCGYCDYKSRYKSNLISHQGIHRKEAV